ncbi:MAG: HAD-IIIA family hydrolase [Desulfobacterales bacterium]|nr:HAD-IIIA family hydrolase [Desulfobacterales bacterium]
MPEKLDKLKNIKLLLLDVDGVLTDGSIVCDDNHTEIKKFNVKDGLGIKLLLNSGIKVGIVSARSSKAVYHRCNDLGIEIIFTNVKDKASVISLIMDKMGISANEIAFVGDDLIDLPLLKKVGCAISVSDAHEVVLKNVDIVTSNKGGNGAVREVCEAILKAQNLWETIIDSFLNADTQ